MNNMEAHHMSYQPQPQFIPQQQQFQQQFILQQQQTQQQQQFQQQFIPQQPQQVQPTHLFVPQQQLHPYQFNVVNPPPPPPQIYQQPARPQYGQGTAGFVAPRRNPGVQQQGVPWTTGLFNCLDDPTNAIVTTIFPCITFGQIADVLDNGHTTCMTSAIMYGAAPCLGKPYRRKLRMRFGLGEYPFPDWLVHLLFPFCALCQEYRELKNRGIDPALGYHGNLERNQRGKTSTTTVPPNNQMMMNMS